MASISIVEFQELVWEYYHQHRRPMPWRDDPSPYNVVISEIMLQQTQVSRVLYKYPEFMTTFPGFSVLALAPIEQLLGVWQGMGYNRRALNLRRLAQTITEEYRGSVPSDPDELVKLPGIGPGTAGSIAAFAYSQPVVFIETNIRRVFIHHFFEDAEGIHDNEIRPLVSVSLAVENPREWYYALMDYGTYLAKTVPNPNRRSKHYAPQSKFEGSDRQLRGALIRLSLASGDMSIATVAQSFPQESPDRIKKLLGQLTKEGFLKVQ